MKKTLVIEPQWKRKHKIIFEANFNKDYKKWGELDEVIARTLWEMWFFDS